MVRETRHLWIGNLPENVREDEIRDLFQRHGRVQSVKLLDKNSSNNVVANAVSGRLSSSSSSSSGKTATVAFIDIRSAAKALRSVRTVAGQPIHISYYEPGSAGPFPSPSVLPPPHNSKDSGGVGGGGSGVSGNKDSCQGETTVSVNSTIEISTSNNSNNNGNSTSSLSTSSSNNALSQGNPNLSSINATSNSNISSIGGGGGGSGGVNSPVVNNNSSSNSSSNNNSNCIPNSPSGGPGMYRQRYSGQHGHMEDSSSHYYDQPKSFSRGRGDGHGFHSRGRRENHRPPFHSRHQYSVENRNNNYRSHSQWNNSYHHENRYAPPVHSDVEERERGERPPSSLPTSAPHTPPSEPSTKSQRRPESPASSVSSRHLISKRRRSRSVSDSGSSDRGSSGGSRSRSGSRSSVSTSVSSSRSRSPSHHGHFPRGGGGTSSTDRYLHNNSSHTTRHSRYSRSRVMTRTSDSSSRSIRHSSRSPLTGRPSSSTSSSPSPHRKIAAPHSPSHSPSSNKSYSPSRNTGGSQSHHSSTTTSSNHHHHRRAPTTAELNAAIKIRNLPHRSSDTSLKDGLYHEYKKHGKVAWVRIHGTGQERYAIVCFKSVEHASRAVSSSQGKLFFGCKIQVTPVNHAKEDVLGGQDEENRLLVEDEPTSVGYPTRTVLITALDATVALAELQTAFEQYGDIVRIDIKKQGTATHAICEFADIASAIRAQWGRHVFKSKEARISFYRNPPTNSLLLDGTAGISDKQVYGQCCQYGAIKQIIMDPERDTMALVQFQEISEAQAAIRQLRSWVIKGKRLQVDFASNEVIRKFLQRVSNGGVVGSPVGSSSPGLISSPSIGNSVAPLHDTINLGRRDRVADDDTAYNALDENDAYRSRKTDSRSFRRNQKTVSANSELDSGDGKECYGSIRSSSYPIRPISPDPHLEHASGKHGRSKSSSKIDLDCHETDAAIVTSSSDIVVGEKSELHSNSGLSSGEKLGGFESDLEPNGSLDSCDAVLTFVDGVSSTSPEPKVDAVRKASPDSAIAAYPIPSRISMEQHRIVESGVGDPRRPQNSSKIRRTSADSVNTSGNGASSQMHSTTTTPPTPTLSVPFSLFNPSASSSGAGADGNDSDDRPGTPLFDENPDTFVPCSATPPHTSSFTPLTKSTSNKPGATNSASPEVLQTLKPENSLKEVPSSSIRTGRSSTDSSADSKNTYKFSPAEQSSPAEKGDSGGVLISSPCSGGGSDNSLEEVTPILSSHICKDGSEKQKSSVSSVTTKGSTSSSVFSEKGQRNQSVVSEDNIFDHDAISSPATNSESEISPRNSPNSVALEQRILKCCETYDRFSGTKPTSESDTIDDKDSGIKSGSECLTTPESTSTPTSSTSTTSRFKFLDFNELMQRPSDIGKSVLARRSVFDEDSKRLENFEEKYDAKGSAVPLVANNWRAIALQRSLSVSSNPSGNWNHRMGHAGGGNMSSHTASPSSMQSQSSASPSTLNTVNAGVLNTRTLSTSSIPSLNCSTSIPVFQSLANLNSKDLNTSMPHPPPTVTTAGPPKPKLYNMQPLNTKPTSQQPPVSSSPGLLPSRIPVVLRRDVPPPSPSVISKEMMKDPRFSERQHLRPNNVEPPVVQSQSHGTHSQTLAEHNSVQHTGDKGSLPKPVERSLSLDSKKGVHPGPQPPTPSPPVAASPQLEGTKNLSAVTRRSSIEMQAQPPQNCKESHPVLLVKSNHEAPLPIPTNQYQHPIKNNTNVLVETKGGKGSFGIPKPELELGKLNVSGIPHQETTVAIVAADHMSFIPTRTESSVPASSGSKDSSRKEKEKKRGTGTNGSSPPISSLPPTTLVNISTAPSTNAARVGPGPESTRVPPHPGQCQEEKKAKKEKETSHSQNHVDEDTFRKSDKDKDKERRDGKKDKREHKEKENVDQQQQPLLPPPRVTATSNDTHSHSQSHAKKDKERDGSSSKRKRDSSTTETDDHDHKKLKAEKDGREPGSHHKVKSTSTHDRRESKDSSSSNRENKENKESSSRNTSSSSSFAESSSVASKEKEKTRDATVKTSSKDKDKNSQSHHRSKEKEKSSSSSKSKHHTSDKSKVSESKVSSSSSSSHHPTPKVEHSSGRDKDKDKGDKKDRGLSPGKDNLKGSSKHHTHSSSSSSHRNSSRSSNKTKESGSKSSSSHQEKRKDSDKHGLDSDSCCETTSSHNSRKEKDGHEKIRKSLKSSHKDKHEKRETSEKRERRQSGGGSISGGGGDKDSEMEREKKRQKKKNKFVVEETETSDSDDEEKKKHHSIFDVVLDDVYVSMYDKVKARSNRACKMQRQAKPEEGTKQDKIKDQLRQLKQSRARKIEKKRSTSMDDGDRSGIQTSSDEETGEPSLMDDIINRSRQKHPKDGEVMITSLNEVEPLMTSDENDEQQDLHSSMDSKNKRKKSDYADKVHKKRGKKSAKSPQRHGHRSHLLESNSECESSVSSIPADSERKKKRSSSQTNASKIEVPHRKSDESMSFSDDSESAMKQQEARVPSHKADIGLKGQTKLQAVDIYSSDSDSSVDSAVVRVQKSPIRVPHPVTNKTKNKEKLNKQKSMKKSLFESSDSTDADEEKKRVSMPKKERKESSSHRSSKGKDGEGKSSRKKHRIHSSSSSVFKQGRHKKQRMESGDGSIDSGSHSGNSHNAKRDINSTMKDILFGPMSASSASEEETAYEPPPRPKTPTIVIPSYESPKKSDVLLSPKKSKSSSGSEERKYLISPTSSLDLSAELANSRDVPPPEKKRKKHHKEKRSRKGDSSSNSSRHSSKASSMIDAKPDFDTLFNSPRVSPVKEFNPLQNSPRLNSDHGVTSSSLQFSTASLDKMRTSPVRKVFEPQPQPPPLPVATETTKNMFSSDEDDDVDDKLKNNINEAIIASSDEPEMSICENALSSAEKLRREEEEKQRHSLFEQDKAIESIVLLDRKSPPMLLCPPVTEDDTTKDDLSKDGSATNAISQEETEDAVAALLETLEGEDDLMEDRSPVSKPQTVAVSSVVQSPPTLRIIEESNESVSVSVSETVDLQNGKRASHTMDEHPPMLPPTPDIQSRKSSLDSNPNAVPDSNDVRASPVKSRQGSMEKENVEHGSSDVYEFHDSDDEKGGKGKRRRGSPKRQSLTVDATSSNESTPVVVGVPQTIAKSPMSSPPIPPQLPSVSPLPTNVNSSPESLLIKPPVLSPIIPVSLSKPFSQHQQQQPPMASMPGIGPPPVLTFPPISGVPMALVPISTPQPFTPVTPVSTESFLSKLTPPLSSPVMSSLPMLSFPTQTAMVPIVTSKNAPLVRNKVDDTIEDVIKMAVESIGAPFSPTTSIVSRTPTPPKPNARGRSKSRDVNALEDSNNSANSGNAIPLSRVCGIGSRGDSVLHIAPVGTPVFTTIPGTAVLTALPTGAMGTKVEMDASHGKKEGVAVSTTMDLIDPKTGILTPMVRQSDEGQYIPMATQEFGPNGGCNLPRVQQPHFASFQAKMEADGKQDERPLSIPPSMAMSMTRNEGLAAAMMAHPQVFQIPVSQYGAILPPSSSPKMTTIPPKFVSSVPLQRSDAPGTAVFVAKSPHYPPPTTHQVQGPLRAPPPTTSTPDFLGGHKITDAIPISISHLGSGPMIRAVFPGSTVPQLLQSGQFQYAVITKAGDLPPSLLASQSSPRIGTASISTTTVPTPHSQQGIIQNVAKYAAPPQPAPEIKSFQIPSATTITKVNASQDQEAAAHRKLMPVHQHQQTGPSLASPVSTSLRSVSPNVAVGSKAQITLAPSPMTHQQQQQHYQQTELFRKTAEGLIRVMPQPDDRPEMMHAPRIETGVGTIPQAAPSPKGGRAHDQYPPRLQLPQYTLTDGEVRVVSTPNDHGGPYRQEPNMRDREYNIHYTTSTGTSPPTSTHGRPGVPLGAMEKLELNKQPNMLPHERNPIRILPSPLQHPPPHSLHSPHAMDQRSTESPTIGSMYPPHMKAQHVYQTPSPAHHQAMPRSDYKIIYTGSMDRPHANSPSYPSSFEAHTAAAAMAIAQQQERERVLSPYAGRDPSLVRGPGAAHTPPPAHGRYSVPPPPHMGEIGERQSRLPLVPSSPPPSQLPPQGDSLLNLLQRYPIMWQGLLALKNDNAACQMHFVSGNLSVAKDSLPSNPDGTIPPLRISQRMRLEQTQLEGVARKMQMEAEHCILLALPCGRDHTDVLQQSNNLRAGFITYLQLKQAAGIVNIMDHANHPSFVIHIFPSCDFANENLARIAPDLLNGVADIAHLLIVIATV